MRFLLDIQLRLRALNNPVRPGAAARDAIEDPANDILFGTAGIWEVAIKTRLGRPAFAVRAETIAREALARGFAELLIRWQSITEPVHFYTVDRKLAPYSSLVVLA